MNGATLEISGSSAHRAAVTGELSDAASQRLLADRGEPLFLARWDRTVFIHYEAAPEVLQKCVPFPLDLRDGRAFVSVVAFDIQRMRPRRGGRLGEYLLKPIGNHGFLNVRTYVRHQGEPGIYFLAEWLSNRLAVHLGPRTFGLPYRFGHLHYEHGQDNRTLRCRVLAKRGELWYSGSWPTDQPSLCAAGSLTEFLLERYTAFTERGSRRRYFRVWHPAWRQSSVDLTVTGDDLLAVTGEWWSEARQIGATYSPGVDVWMGRPHRMA